MEKRTDRKPRPRAATMRGVMLVIACMLMAAAWGATRSARQGSAPAVARRRPAIATVAAVPARLAAANATSASEWRYDTVTRRNLFMPRQAQKPGVLAPLPPVAPMPIDAFQLRDVGVGDSEADAGATQPQWIYAGYATLNGNMVAIVENTATKRAEFLSVGQTLDGSVVSSITPLAIKLRRGNESTELPISQAFTATPLNEPPRPAGQAGGDRSGRGQGGFGRGGGSFLQRLMPALRDNPDLANQLMQGLAGPNPAGGPSASAPGSNRPPQGGQQ